MKKKVFEKKFKNFKMFFFVLQEYVFDSLDNFFPLFEECFFYVCRS